MAKTANKPANRAKSLTLVFLLLGVVLCSLFFRVLLPGNILFSNDSPLGAQVSEARRAPEVFSGQWQDLNSIGYREAGGVPNLTYGLLYLLGPYYFAKFFAPAALLILGLGAWTFFRQLGLAPVACIVAAIAAALNSGFFSAACWGVASHAICVGMVYFCLAAVANSSFKSSWLPVAAGGCALGLAVTEGADIGAIFSLYVAAFVLFESWLGGGHHFKALAAGAGRVALVALLAALVAAQVITVLVGTQIKGVAGMQQDTQTKVQRWDWATQWSLPKREALGYVMPGLFGYRMDTPDGGVYWGAMGRDPGWYHYWDSGKQGPQPQGGLRFSGGGVYAGVLVIIVGLWAFLQAFRRKDSVFQNPQSRMIWFWTLVAVISLLLAFGRFAPFYQIIYGLPYFSTIRNPGKFAHVVSWALVVLFAYGLDGLWRLYMQGATTTYTGLLNTVREWWQRVRGFDRKWTGWSLAALAACLLAWLIYASSKEGLVKYLQEVGFEDRTLANQIASFSSGQVGWFILTLAVCIGLLTLVISGVFRGARAKTGALLMGLFLVLDLGRANQPWIIVWDHQHKYATNLIIDLLRQKPYEQRVAILPRWFTGVFNIREAAMADQIIGYLYGIEWSQHLFLYYNIQSLDLIQMPRMPEDLLAFDMALSPRSGETLPLIGRKWQLTNTRYLLGATNYLEILNKLVDPVQQRFRYKQKFAVVPKPGYEGSGNAQDWTAVPDPGGPFAVYEFAGALPRARLYSNWLLSTNDQAALQQLANQSYDPERTVIVTGGVPAASGTSTNQGGGKVEFASYAPKRIVLKAETAVPVVLLLNDRYDPNWKVLVDGKPETLLKCNYLMRGVLLNPGSHTVQFSFEPPMGSFYVSLAGVGLGFILWSLLLVVKNNPPTEVSPVSESPPTERRKPKPLVRGSKLF